MRHLIPLSATMLLAAAAIGEDPSFRQFLEVRAPSAPTLAPDGTLYVEDWPTGVNQIYRRAPGADEFEQLTSFEDGVSSFLLSPDGRWLAINASIGGSEQNDIFLLDTRTKQLKTVHSDPDVVYTAQLWLRDSSGFIYTANDESPADFHILRFDLADSSSTRLLDEKGFWGASDITRDGARLLVGRYFSVAHAEAHELDARTGELTSLTQTSADGSPAFNQPVAYAPGEGEALIISDVDTGTRRLFAVPLRDSGARELLPDLRANELDSAVMSPSREFLATVHNQDGYGELRVFDAQSMSQVGPPPTNRGVVLDVSFQGRTLVWRLSNAQNPGVAYAWEVLSRALPRPITEAHDAGLDLASFQEPTLIEYESFDGLRIPAFLFTPESYDRSRPIPFVAVYHGGPEGQSRPDFSAPTQYFLSRGFGVIEPNVRGSTGYGREFHQLDNYRKRWDSVKDGVAAVRWLIDNGYTEPGRVAAFGGSYGGFMACATVIEGQELYGASVNIVGIVNFETFLEQTRGYRRKLREVEYGPLSDPEFLASVSPIHMVDRIRVPMLIAHGLNDPRVPVGEAMQLAVELQKRDLDPELLFFPDEGHGFAKLENRALFYERAARFLDRTIGYD